MITVREEIRRTYPDILTLENVRCILHISKRKTAWMLQNGVIRCETSGKQTRQYRVKMDDLFEYLDRVDKADPSVVLPHGIFTTRTEKKLVYEKAMPHPITLEKPPEDFRAWLEDEWYAESNLLLSQDIGRITGYDRHTVQRWLQEKRIRSVWTQNELISSKTWLLSYRLHKQNRNLRGSWQCTCRQYLIRCKQRKKPWNSDEFQGKWRRV